MDTTPTESTASAQERDQRVNDVVARILARSGTALASTEGQDNSGDAGALEREARAGTRRVDTGASDREDISEVEYRQVRLEKVVLVGLRTTQSEEEAENSLRELAALAETAGSRVLDGIIQRRMKPDPATYLGSGKAQVELAQLEYLLPRLRGWGESMSRQAGGRVAGGAGIGSRGPGETKIELDRRRIRTRMAKLRADIARMEPARRTQRGSRRRGAVPSVAIAGYTNAGKSTLLNRLTDAGVLVQDALFATLDPTVRRARAADGREYTLTDTVGFVRNLPTQLVEAFRSTLEEVGQADVILHVVDAAHPDPVSQVQAVRAVIDTIEGASDIPELIALNKADLASPEQIALLRTVFPGAVPLSAHTGWGVDALRAALEDMLPRPRVAIDVILPYSAGSLVHRIHEEGEVDREEYVETGTRIVARVDEALAALIAREAVGGTVGDPAGSGQ